MRILEMDFLRARPMGQPIEHNFDNLDVGLIYPGYSTLVPPDMSCNFARHVRATVYLSGPARATNQSPTGSWPAEPGAGNGSLPKTPDTWLPSFSSPEQAEQGALGQDNFTKLRFEPWI